MKEQRDAAEPVRQGRSALREAAPAVQHALNNALMVVTSNLDLLGRAATEAAPRRQIERAREAMQRLEALLRGYLDIARRADEDVVALPPDQALAQALPLLRVVLGSRHGFEQEPAEGIGPALLDRARLDVALLSLMRDSAAGMKQGAQIVARAENRGGAAVALRLLLPAGYAPGAEVARLLSEAASTTGGRLEALADGMALVWPRAPAGVPG